PSLLHNHICCPRTRTPLCTVCLGPGCGNQSNLEPRRCPLRRSSLHVSVVVVAGWFTGTGMQSASACEPSPTSTRPPTCPAPAPFAFGSPLLVDAARGGGEPGIFQLTTGQHAGEYLYAAHAGTTLLWRGGAQNIGDYLVPYRNQTYIWRSRNARSWRLVNFHGTGMH